MEELFFFYWYSWFFVIVVYFFLERTKEQSFLFISLLAIISSKPIQVSIADYISISLSLLLLVAFALLYFIYLKLGLYEVISTYILLFTYVGISLWYKVSPASFVIEARFFIPGLLAMFPILLHRSFRVQRALLFLGMALGQIVYQFILRSYHLETTFYNETFFITFYHTLLLLLCLQGCIRGVRFLGKKLVIGK